MAVSFRNWKSQVEIGVFEILMPTEAEFDSPQNYLCFFFHFFI